MKRRPPAANFPSDLLRSFPRSQTPSSVSSRSSTFLSPPISEPWERSPPPRSDADEYLSAKGRHHRRRRIQHRHSRKRHNTREESSGLHIAYKGQGEAQGPVCEGCEISRLVDADAFLDSSPGRSPEELKPLQEHSPRRQLSDRKLSLHRIESAQSLSRGNSPAAQALRRLSQSDIEARDAKAGPFRRASLAIASSLGLTKLGENDSERSSGRSTPQGESIVEGQTTKQGTNEPSKDGGASTVSRKADGPPHQQHRAYALKTPSSISLWKASNVHMVSAREDMITPASPRPPQKSGGETRITPPTVELIAFYSEHKPTSVDKGESGVSPEGRSRVASPALVHLCSFDKVMTRQSGATAELAVTYADVHIAPGTFSTTVKSPAPLLSSEAPVHLSSSVGNASTSSGGGSGTSDATPRICAVQLRSSNSVHEIIWREDETTSGSSISCSTAGSASPALAIQFDSIGGGGSVSDDGHGHVDQDEDGENSEATGGDGGGDDGGGQKGKKLEKKDIERV